MITVIGGSGFIGTRLCQRLADNQIAFEIVDLKIGRRFADRTKIADIRDLDALREAISGRKIIHLAAVHRDDVRDPREYYMTNVQGTRNVCQVAVEKQIESIVFTSTVAVYGFAGPNTAEDGKVNPFNEYGKTKFAAEEILRDWYCNRNMDRSLTIVRPTVVFGEGNRGNVYNLLKQINSGRFIMIGAGDNCKSMAYVENVAAFLQEAANCEDGSRLFNYIDKPDYDVNTLVTNVRKHLHGSVGVGLRIPFHLGLALGFFADFLAKYTGKKLPISSIRVKKFCASTSFATNANSLNGFVPPVVLSDGLSRTLDWEFKNDIEDREVFYTE